MIPKIPRSIIKFPWDKKLSVFHGVLLSLLVSSPTVAQIKPDATLPHNSLSTQLGNVIQIDGGTKAGNNLFHSFTQFSVPTGGTAYFNNTSDVSNIFSRVTGGSASSIDGILKANGTANFFLLNPNGIVFGRNASLNINGSFVASTANSILFTDGTVFSATAPQTAPLLTVSVPIGLHFGSTPKDIVNQSQASPNEAVNSYGLPVGLQVLPAKTLALVGGNITLNGGNLTALGGQVALGSVASTGLVTLTPTDKGYSLGYAGIQKFGDITLSQGAWVDASADAGGNIFAQGGRVTLTEKSQITADTFSQNGGEVSIQTSQLNLQGGSGISSLAKDAGRGGNVTVNATDSVTLSGTAPDGSMSGLTVATQGTGNAGTLRIDTGKLIIQGGAQAQNVTVGSGNAGDMLVTATDSVTLTGTTPNGQNSSGLFAVTQGTGYVGTLRINTGKLIIQDGAQVQNVTYNSGNAGDILVSATDSVEASGVASITPTNGLPPFPSSLTSQAFQGSTGNSGNITITTGKVSVRDGANIGTTTAPGAGKGGNLTVFATDSVEINGTSEINSTSNNVPSSSALTTANGGAQTGGNLQINTNRLIVQGGGQISTSTYGIGNAGDLIINALESVEVSGSSPTLLSQLNAQSLGNATGNAGNIQVTTGRLLLQDGGQISNGTVTTGNGGNLTVNASQSIEITGTALTNNSGLLATARGTQPGNAGNITTTAPSIQIENQGKIFTQTDSGNGGDIVLSAKDSLILRHNSSISSSAGTKLLPGNGGNITFNVGLIIALENSNITANAYTGKGGNIQITTQGLFNSLDSLITASSQKGIQGIVNIQNLGISVTNSLAPIKHGFDSVTQTIAQSCLTSRNRQRGKFTVTGLDVLPITPFTNFDLWYTLPMQAANTTSQNKPSTLVPVATTQSKPWKIGDPIVEATDIVHTADGKVLLSATPQNTPESANTLVCHRSEEKPKG